ncbi:hypothetical protein KAF44_26465 (plasmid) [Cupriavidus necator]|nr:hypothetical protein KAF44_26465 [Cupriavidus necator]
MGVINQTWDKSFSAGMTPDIALRDLTAMAHQQFPWQVHKSLLTLMRYYRLLRHPALAPIVEAEVGMEVRTYFLLGVIAGGELLNRPWIARQRALDVVGITPHQVRRFYEPLTVRVGSLRAQIVVQQRLDRRWGFTWNPLEGTPLVRLDRNAAHAIAPISEYFYRAITNGLYYRLVNRAGFSTGLGASFEAYIGDVLREAFPAPRYGVAGETQYTVGKQAKLGTDWIVTDGSANLFIECKTKRLRLDAKMPDAVEEFEAQLDVLAGIVVQLYKNIRDAQDGHTPAWRPNTQQIYPLVITLDEWHLLGPNVLDALDLRVKARLRRENLPLSVLQEMPYTTCSAQDFESAVLIMAELGLDPYLREKTQPDCRVWSLKDFTMTRHAELAKRVHRPMFWDDLREIAPFEAVAVPALA